MPWWISILLWALVHAPQIIAVLKELWQLIHHPAVVASYPLTSTDRLGEGADKTGTYQTPREHFQSVWATYKASRDAQGLTALRDRWNGVVARAVSPQPPPPAA